ncbi:hypothetical protein AB4Y77_10980 [Paenarthrobacter sp. YAF11_1]|uniref:hypothetical protein n=1 Tax=Paenarthrobacter sp. YAF11_1 TaxID=3233074 RepID=UPI003F9E07B3
MTIEMPQVTQDESVDNSLVTAEEAVTTTEVADMAEAILVESDSLYEWLVHETRKDNLA